MNDRRKDEVKEKKARGPNWPEAAIKILIKLYAANEDMLRGVGKGHKLWAIIGRRITKMTSFATTGDAAWTKMGVRYIVIALFEHSNRF